MRWKLLRRRLSISAPRMIVRSHLPLPLRWALAAIALGFSAALALWAFEFGKDIAGLDRHTERELQALRAELAKLREERERALSIANTAESLLKAEKAAQDKLTQQVKSSEAENSALKRDLGFFERLLPAAASEGLSIRGLQAEQPAPGQVRFQLLVMQSAKALAEFDGRYDISLSGLLDNKAWAMTAPQGPQALQMKQYLRVEGMIACPPTAVVKTITVKVTDVGGVVKAELTVNL